MPVLLLSLIVLGMVATIKKVTDWLAYLRAGHRNGITTQILVWALGVVVAFLTTAQAAIDHLATTGGTSVQTWNGLTKALLGIGLASIASVVHDLSDSAKSRPPLVPPPSA